MSKEPAFGFNSLDEFKPKPKPTKTRTHDIEIEQVDSIGENLGFTPRNNTIERRKKKGVTKPAEQFNIRAHIEDINTFVDYAETSNKSYREVFAELVANLPKE